MIYLCGRCIKCIIVQYLRWNTLVLLKVSNEMIILSVHVLKVIRKFQKKWVTNMNITYIAAAVTFRGGKHAHNCSQYDYLVIPRFQKH